MTYKCLLVFCITIAAVNAASVHLKLFKNPSRVQERFILKLVSGREANKAVNRAKFVESSLEKVEKVREVIDGGIRDLKTDADEYSKKHGVKKIDETRWKALTESIDKRVSLLKKTILTKDSSNPDNIWELFLVDFEITFGAFVQNVTEDFQTVDGNKENEKPVLVLFIQAGIGSLIQELQETINPYEEVNASPDVPIQMPKTVLTLISSFIQGQSGNAQNDAPTSQRPIQALAESIGQAVSNLNPFRTTTSTPSTTQSSSSPSVANDVSTEPSTLASSDEKQENIKIENVANNQSASPLNVVIHVVYDKPSLDALTTQSQSTQSSSNTVVEPKLPERSGENAPQEKFNQQIPITLEGSSQKPTSVAEIENKHVSQGDTFNIIIDLSSVTSNIAQSNLNTIKKEGEVDKKPEPLKEDDKNLVQNVSTTEAVVEGQFEDEKLSSVADSSSSSLLSSLPSSPPSSSPSSPSLQTTENVVSTTEIFVKSESTSSTAEPLSSSAVNEENENAPLTESRIKPVVTTIKSVEFTTEEIKSSSEPITSIIAEVVPSSPVPPDTTTIEQIQTTLPADVDPLQDFKFTVEETKTGDQNIQPQEIRAENAQSTTTEDLQNVNLSDGTYNNCRFEQLKRQGNKDKNVVKKLKRKGTSR